MAENDSEVTQTDGQTESAVTPAASNDSRYVSTTRGVQGGYLFVAPVGTTLPTDYSSTLAAEFVNAGYIGEDGFTEGTDSDSSDFKDINGDIVDSSSAGTSETLVLKLLNMDAPALKVQYGSANVISDATKGLEVKHRWSKANDTWSCVLELVLKDGRRWRKVIPSGKVTELGEFTGSSSELAGREVTLTYITDSDGVGCFDYIAPVASN